MQTKTLENENDYLMVLIIFVNIFIFWKSIKIAKNNRNSSSQNVKD